jgi:hypothetical protein
VIHSLKCRYLFIDMSLKTKHLTIRLSEEQLKKLTDVLMTEKRTKSSLLRDILCDYIDGNDGRINKQSPNKSIKNKD